ncbi:MAG: hypothetical protein IKQ44_12635 [Lachnospiraceae bacterium]|nr:hypothetical protein [Lachnospiraceae bacterium]
MAGRFYDEIKNRIALYEDGDIFFTTDFKEIANLATIRKYLGRQVEDGTIRRVMDGVYEKPKYSKILDEFIPTDPEKVAYALAKKYHWTISPCGDVALNKLGLSTQVPVVWSYVSDGPYREFTWDNIILSFKHKTNREISLMSRISIMVIEAIKTLGKDNIDEKTIAILRSRLSGEEKAVLLKDATDSTSWIFDIVKKVCI